MSRDTRAVRKKLQEKGFQIEEDSADIYCRFYYRGKKTQVRSKLCGHSKAKYKTLSDILLTLIARTLFFDNKAQFESFLDDSLSREEYEKMLIVKNKIRPQ